MLREMSKRPCHQSKSCAWTEELKSYAQTDKSKILALEFGFIIHVQATSYQKS